MKPSAFLAMALLAGPLVAATDSLEEKFEGLKDAVASKDAIHVKKLSLELFPLVTQAICETAPEDESERPLPGTAALNTLKGSDCTPNMRCSPLA